MRKFIITFLACLISFSVFARDDVGDYSIKDALAANTATERLGKDVKFYFGEQKHGNVAHTFGTYKTNKKTNAFNKSDREACQWVFLSAMLALRDRAIKEGGNAVVNIRSFYKSKLTSSTKTFRCGVGAVVAGVALKGTVVKLK
ncbi:MAG: excinuclease [Gammaproteobacteria bacterium]|nr:excinuclease [Gammaproteobacteria bacterium]MDH5777190.1 excinuclease [Gammaproteobacteria bacterium]